MNASVCFIWEDPKLYSCHRSWFSYLPYPQKSALEDRYSADWDRNGFRTWEIVQLKLRTIF